MSQQLAHELAQLRNQVNDLERKLERAEHMASDACLEVVKLRTEMGELEERTRGSIDRLYLKQKPIGRRRTVKREPKPVTLKAPDPGGPLPGDSPQLVEFLNEQKKLQNRGRK